MACARSRCVSMRRVQAAAGSRRLATSGTDVATDGSHGATVMDEAKL